MGHETTSNYGRVALLDELSPFVPDEFINTLLPAESRRGRPREFSDAQLYRVTLLALLTPAHSFNLLVELLPENKAWRSFARQRNRWAVPDAKMLHEFRDRMGVRQGKQTNVSAALGNAPKEFLPPDHQMGTGVGGDGSSAPAFFNSVGR
jgi:hypothetical protein